MLLHNSFPSSPPASTLYRKLFPWEGPVRSLHRQTLMTALSPDLALGEYISDPAKFAEACGYMISPSFNLQQLKTCLAKDPSLAAARGRYGSAAYYAADRDGDEEFVSFLDLHENVIYTNCCVFDVTITFKSHFVMSCSFGSNDNSIQTLGYWFGLHHLHL